jgi:hypothetical protein
MVPVRRELTVDGGEVKTTTLSLKKTEEDRAPTSHERAPLPPPIVTTPEPPPAEKGGAVRTIGYVTAGLGVAGMAVFTIFGLSAKSTFDKLKSECGSKGCSDADHLERIDRGKSAQTMANIGLVVGIVGLGSGGTLILLGGKKKDPGASVGFSNGGATISYQGSF